MNAATSVVKVFIDKKAVISKKILKYKVLYFFMLPILISVFVFSYVPMYGIILAFKDFSFGDGILKSPWVEPFGKYFLLFFKHTYFKQIIFNTVGISLLKILSGFFATVSLALIFNEIRNIRFKKITQTALYLPHFISWVIVAGFLGRFLSLDYGLLNQIKVVLFGGDPILWLGESKYFWTIVVLSNIWKEVGWGSILYLAAIAGIDQQLYESAYMDGAGRLKQALYITIPGIAPMMGIVLALSMGSIMSAGFDQIYLLQTLQTYDVSMIIDTYIMEVGLRNGQYGYATAVGLFQAVIGLIMILSFNKIAKKYFSISIW
ncbi:MAG: hypothetical protein A2Y21_05480 [Clostridiales bacterium GWC2_40_7]|nr:MAG: hypothetical protein A2Y21_05480 [Clostridiales bacterium GWC2_40_7]